MALARNSAAWGSAALLGAMLAATAAPNTASAYTYKVIYSFCSKADCADGSGPQGALVMDGAGNLYGTTPGGGKLGANGSRDGTVFELIPNASRTRWRHKVIYNFCPRSGCPDGENPVGALIIDANGNLYGTTPYAGQGSDAGTVFKLSPDGDRWRFQTLHSFCRKDGCPDGWAPRAALTYAGETVGLPYDGVSPLYGTTDFGGRFTPNDTGTVFRLTRDQASDTWHEDVLYSFCGSSSSDCKNPMPSPATALTIGSDGAFYGTSDDDGYPGDIFRVWQHGDHWKGGARYTFCTLTDCADGTSPQPERLSIGQDGTLYGTTRRGGAHGGGTVFSFDPSIAHLTTLYSFCALTECADGKVPEASLLLGASGDLFGTATAGGIPDEFGGGGTVFQIHNGAFQLLHQFCSEANCADGKNPEAGLIKDSAGVLYGTASRGGPNNGGVVFALVP